MIKIAIQGIKGSYSSEAVYRIFKKLKEKYELIECDSFLELFQNIKSKTFLGLVPIENSNNGGIIQSLDLISNKDFEILCEFNLEVKHCLIGNKNKKYSKKVYSHKEALYQCLDFLKKNKYHSEEYVDTAKSVLKIKKGNSNDLAIAGKFCSKLYHMKILKENIQNVKMNFTRFLLMKNKNKKFPFEKKLSKKEKVSLIFDTANIPSALYKCLGGFATNNINLTKIESRPKKEKNKILQYLFHIDFIGNLKNENVKKALEELKFFSNKVLILGNYEILN